MASSTVRTFRSFNPSRALLFLELNKPQLSSTAMQRKFLIFLLCNLIPVFASCQKHATAESASVPPSPKVDACTLITKEEIQAIQGSPITDTKGSESSAGAFRVSQCYFATAEPNKSVSLAVTQSEGAGKRSPRDFWNETFGRFKGSEKEREREGDNEKKESLREQRRGTEEEHESAPPKKIDGVGEEAYWTASRIGGALYVLKKDAFIRISVGGPDNIETKLTKSKALAAKALPRL